MGNTLQQFRDTWIEKSRVFSAGLRNAGLVGGNRPHLLTREPKISSRQRETESGLERPQNYVRVEQR